MIKTPSLNERYDARVIEALGLKNLIILDEELNVIGKGRQRSMRSFHRLSGWDELFWQMHGHYLEGSETPLGLKIGWTRAVIPVGCDGAFLTSTSTAASVQRGSDKLVIASIHEVVDRRAWPQVHSAVLQADSRLNGPPLTALEPFRSGHYYAEYAGDRMLILATSEAIGAELATLLKLAL